MKTTMLAGDKQVAVKPYRAKGEPTIYDTLRTAVLHHNQLRDESGMGGREWRTWIVECEGERYYISYNGRVWCGRPRDWTPDTVEVVFS